MIYRIDIQHFLGCAIDYFTRDEIININYMIISARVQNSGKMVNIGKCINLYPTPEITAAYADYDDPKMIDKMYKEMIYNGDKPTMETTEMALIYKSFVKPLLDHSDIMIICDKSENIFIDSLCDILKDQFRIEVIDLNELFSKGYTGRIRIDRKEIKDKAVEIRRYAAKMTYESLESTEDGRFKILNEYMNKKDKKKKLRSLGINVNDYDDDRLDEMLIESWVKNGNSEED